MEYNPFLPEVQQNPFPYYTYLRQHVPVYQVPGVGFWAVSRYDDVSYILKNPQMLSSSSFMSTTVGDLDPFPPHAPAIIAMDPPDHTRLRKLVNRAFTPRRVASLESHIREVANHLVEQIPAQGEFDLVTELAGPLPVIAIAELLGVPPEQRDDFKRWSNDIVRAHSYTSIPAEEHEQIRQSLTGLRAYFQASIAAYRQQPGDNLISDLIRAEEEHQTLTSDEILSLVVFLLLAGSETTTNLIGNAMLALLSHPQELTKVRTNPTLIRNVIEEVLRYDGPIQLLPRKAMQEITLAGTTIPAGAVVMPLLGSANRDERRFSHPDRFDIMRSAEGHVGFGFGIHFCLGAQLARLEGKSALEALLGRFPRLALKEPDVPRLASLIVRGPQRLPLVVSTA